MRTTVAVLAALGLAACTTTPPMQSALAPLDGQPVERVLAQLGPPTSTTSLGTDTLYQWYRGKGVPSAPTANSLPVPMPPGENTTTSGVFSGVPVAYSCDVRILAGADGRIKDAQYGEQTGGCRESARKLSQLAVADTR